MTSLRTEATGPVTRSEPAGPPPQSVRVNVDSLILGQPLHYPLLDESGVLLLAEGTVLSSEVLRLLRQWDVRTVCLHETDARHATLGSQPAEPTSGLFDTELAQRLDAICDGGLLRVSNSGPAVRARMARPGRVGYRSERCDQFRQQQQAAGESLDGIMQSALRGQAVSSEHVGDLVLSHLESLTEDADCLFAIAAEADRKILSEHCLQMALLGMAIGVEMGLDETNVRQIGIVGLVHDLGMLKVPSALRDAPRLLSAAEFFEIKKHPLHTLEMLERAAGFPRPARLAAFQVHERPNGTGYPRARQRDQIHLFARILHVADAYVALTSPRPYRAALMPYGAMECLLRQAQLQNVDADVVRVLLRVLSLFPIGSYVALSDGSVARVLRRKGDRYWSPIVQRLRDRNAQPVADGPEAVVDLEEQGLTILQALPRPGRTEVAFRPEILALSERRHREIS